MHLFREEDVVWLDVEVYLPPLMDVSQPRRDIRNHRPQLLARQLLHKKQKRAEGMLGTLRGGNNRSRRPRSRKARRSPFRRCLEWSDQCVGKGMEEAAHLQA